MNLKMYCYDVVILLFYYTFMKPSLFNKLKMNRILSDF